MATATEIRPWRYLRSSGEREPAYVIHIVGRLHHFYSHARDLDEARAHAARARQEFSHLGEVQVIDRAASLAAGHKLLLDEI